MDKENQNEPNTVEGILRNIEQKADTGEYLYRGEPEHYQDDPYCGKVSSNLYRVFLELEDFDVEAEQFDIEDIQMGMLEAVKEFCRKPTSEIERLAEIQHYGGKTNLIDFTEDYLVALFMACDGSPRENGRVILEKKEWISPYIEKPYEPINRVIAQKSVFVRHPDGFISPSENNVIDIPAVLKQPILRHLRNSHGIAVETIYNDVHGFIKDQSIHLEVYKLHYVGLTREQRGDSENG